MGWASGRDFKISCVVFCGASQRKQETRREQTRQEEISAVTPRHIKTRVIASLNTLVFFVLVLPRTSTKTPNTTTLQLRTRNGHQQHSLLFLDNFSDGFLHRPFRVNFCWGPFRFNPRMPRVKRQNHSINSRIMHCDKSRGRFKVYRNVNLRG